VDCRPGNLVAVGVWVDDNVGACVKVRVWAGVCDGTCVSVVVGFGEKVAVKGFSVNVAVARVAMVGEQEENTQAIQETNKKDGSRIFIV
jgi:hypothetical protein